MLDIRCDAFSTRNYVKILFPYHLGTLLRAIHDSKSRSRGWLSSVVATASHPSSTRRYPPFRIVLTDRIFEDVPQFDRFNFRYSTFITRRDEPIIVTTDKGRKNSITNIGLIHDTRCLGSDCDRHGEGGGNVHDRRDEETARRGV